MENQKLFESLIDKFGKDRQIDKAIEEMSELTKALLKYRENPAKDENIINVLEELEDVKIMCEQLEIMFLVNSENKIYSDKIRENKFNYIKSLLS